MKKLLIIPFLLFSTAVLADNNISSGSNSESGAVANSASNSQGGAGGSIGNTTATSGSTVGNTNSTSGSTVGNTSATSGASNAAVGNTSATTGAASASGNASGNVSIDNHGVTNAPAPDLSQAVGFAQAPALTTTFSETCMGSTSAGAGFAGGAFSIGSTWEDEACIRRLDAREIKSMGDTQAAKEIMCASEEVRAAFKRVGRPCAIDGGNYAMAQLTANEVSQARQQQLYEAAVKKQSTAPKY